MEISYDLFSEIGSCRKINQDMVTAHVSENVSVFAVADGMGGYSEGEYASSQAVKAIDDLWLELCENQYSIQAAVDLAVSAIYKINREIQQYSREKNIICGSTLSVLIIMNDSYAAINIGDSPIFYADRSRFIHISNEHSLGQMKLKSSPSEKITPDPKRDGRLVQAVGVVERIYPYVRTGQLVGTQAFLICSDGVSKLLAPHTISDGLKRVAKGKATKDFLDSLKEEVYCNGATDNLSAVAVYVKDSLNYGKKIKAFYAIIALCIIVMLAFGGIMLKLLLNT